MKHLLALLLLPACASMTTGTTQNIAVETSPPAAQCDLSNDKGKWFLKETPGSVTINRSASALVVSCDKGELTGTTSAESTTQGSAFGNILLGGIIGASVDMSTGAAYGYPATVNVRLAGEHE